MKKGNDREPQSAKTDSNQQKENQASPKVTTAHQIRIPMEVVIYWSGALSLVAAILAALFGALGHRDQCIWMSFAAVVLAVFSGFCWLQNYHWNRDALIVHPANTMIGERPYMFLQRVDFDLSAMKNSQAAHVAQFNFQNSGKSPAFVAGGNSYVTISDVRFTEVPIGEPVTGGTSRQFVPAGAIMSQIVVCKNIFGDNNASETWTKLRKGKSFFIYTGTLITKIE